MDRFQRYYRLHRILSSRRFSVSRATLERELECSPATVKRILEELRNYGAPIEYVREANGYRYTPGAAFELPGIWFSPSELQALLVADHFLEHAEPGLIAETLAPLRQKLQSILALEHLGRGELARRVRILRMAGRGPGKFFNLVADALARRRRLAIEYHARGNDEVIGWETRTPLFASATSILRSFRIAAAADRCSDFSGADAPREAAYWSWYAGLFSAV